MLGRCGRDQEKSQDCVGGHGRGKGPQGGELSRVAVQSLGGPSGPLGLTPISVTLGELFNICSFPCCPFVNWEYLIPGSTSGVFV